MLIILPAPITEGIGKLAEDVGKWFGNLWSGTAKFFSGAWTNTTKFIANTGRAIGGFFTSIFEFFYNLPGKVLGYVKDGLETAKQALMDLPSNIWKAIVGLVTGGGSSTPTPMPETPSRFSGGLSVLGGRTAFNEYEALNMPDGVTYIPLTASNTLDRFVGGGGKTTNNNMEITVNVTGTTNPQETAELVIAEIDKIYSSVNV